MSITQTGTLKARSGRLQGPGMLAALCALVLVLGACMLPWVRIVNQEALFGAMKLKSNTIGKLGSSYSILNLLSFVQISKQGVLGLFAAVLLVVQAAGLCLQVIALATYLTGRHRRDGGLLKLCSRVQIGMLFTLVAALGTIAFTVFANTHYGVVGFVPSALVYVLAALSLGLYLLSKRIEKPERVRLHEHGIVVEFKRNWVLFLFLVPCFVFFLINNYLPMVGIYFAFTKFNFRDSFFASPFVGFDNFEFLVKAQIFQLTKNTVLYNIVFILLGNILQIFFAILISHVKSPRLKKTSQTMIFMPFFVSYVILRVLVYNMFEYDMGLVNTTLVSLGLGRMDFYNTPSYWPFLITLFYLWKNIGYGMVVYLATITGISTEYYEAAEIDGAGIYQQIRYITVPLLKPTFIILLLYALGSIMKGQFELFYQLVGTNGILYNATDIFDTYVYRITTTEPLSMGLGTAAGLFQSIFGFVLVVSINGLIKRRNPEYALF